MDLTSAQLDEIEDLISKLKTLDPSELPEPAAELVELLNRLLDSESDS